MKEHKSAEEERPAASAREIKALAHPLRLRILRLCGLHELTNKQLADRLGQDPGTMLYHVRQLLATGFLEPAAVRTGESGALEKPYRSTGRSWHLDTALGEAGPDGPLAPVDAFREELTEAGPDALASLSRFVLHLSEGDAEDLLTRIHAVLSEYTASDRQRSEQPAYGGIFVLHRSSD
ncbi:winged helix-turn-helix transcriptional regulator [Arthrobacter sp. UKPF54-2]|uniref:ArsR/SmtB family transcription factor n=1 Tax=Arthrobacter sp. UKPF54-2 TaxID=2600159 RepID=UPI0011B177B8|nr:winged helix-turn-helix domain-containing protein [Arthrobacter sp. UKPF54-2]QDY90585.1 winged helix-turn-helix transcriptional regulator [Arthrobacter sp. UKPF54-2]